MSNVSFWIFGLLQVSMALVLGAFYVRQRREKRKQEQWVAQVAGRPFWRLMLAQPAYLSRQLKLYPAQASGLLIDLGTEVRLLGQWPGTDQTFEFDLPKDASRQPTWLIDPPATAGYLSWLRFSTPRGELMATVDSGNAWRSREGLADLMRSVYPGLRLPQQAQVDFALEKNRFSLAAMILMALLAAYALADLVIWARWELIDAQILAFLTQSRWLFLQPLALGVVFFIVWRALRAGSVPRRESSVLAGLLSLIVCLAAVPVIKRIDRAGMPPAVDYRYRIEDRVVRLLPVNASAGLPPLRFTGAPEYWRQFEIGTEVMIPLARGRLGLWQLDHDRYDPPIRAFYERAAER